MSHSTYKWILGAAMVASLGLAGCSQDPQPEKNPSPPPGAAVGTMQSAQPGGPPAPAKPMAAPPAQTN
jgi:hypothetical protein